MKCPPFRPDRLDGFEITGGSLSPVAGVGLVGTGFENLFNNFALPCNSIGNLRQQVPGF
jgi:hypothetical protein